MASRNSCKDIEPELSLSKIWNTLSVKKGLNEKRRDSLSCLARFSNTYVFGHDDLLEIRPADLLFIAHGLPKKLFQSVQVGLVDTRSGSGVCDRCQEVHDPF